MIKILSWGVGTISTPGKPNSDNFFSTFWTPLPLPPGLGLGAQYLQILDTWAWSPSTFSTLVYVPIPGLVLIPVKRTLQMHD